MEKALDIDNSDPTLFFKFAAVAIRAGDLMAARNALEVSFRVTHTVPGQQIRHWPSLDLLISVTYKLEDCLACLRYIEWALKVNIYIRALKQRVPITSKSSFKGETQRYVVKLRVPDSTV